jgi:flavin-dependent dehydrogenase
MTDLPAATDIFVIGGGPAGLAAAIAARRRGFDVTVADCAIPPIDKACGEGIMPDGLAAARALGIDFDAVETYPFRGIRFCDRSECVEASFPAGPGVGIRRTALHQLLVDRAAAAGVRAAWGARITGISDDGVLVDGRLLRARWIVGADGGQSRVRCWAKLDASTRDTRRFGFRRHYRMAPWSDFMQLHWGDGCQLYVTPVATDEVCVALISRDPGLRLDIALPAFPDVERRLRAAEPATAERGAVSASRQLKSVYRGRVALVGDASGSIDAITGEGLCVLFQQAAALAVALAAGDLSLYQAEHRRLGRRPQFMADCMLLLDSRARLRRRAIRALASNPRVFAALLSMHVGKLSLPRLFTSGVALGWQMLTL